ncbi:VOC family protein [bacterium]|nr:VOC family protein [bacterium]
MAQNQFKKVAFTCYPVQDMARAQAFYEGVLGLIPGDNFQGTWQEYDFGGTTFAISSMVAEFVRPGTQGAVAFEVSDIKTLVQELRAKNVQFASGGEVMDTPVCLMAFMLDPDGNTISLHQCK